MTNQNIAIHTLLSHALYKTSKWVIRYEIYAYNFHTMWHTVFPLRPVNKESYCLYHIDNATNRFEIGNFLTRLRGTSIPYAHCTQYSIGVFIWKRDGVAPLSLSLKYLMYIWPIGIVIVVVGIVYDFCMRPFAFGMGVGWNSHICT